MQTNRTCIWALFLMTASYGGAALASPSDNSADYTAWIEEGKQVFLARAQLEAYLGEMEKDGVGVKMGLGDVLGEKAADNGFFTLLEESARLMAFDTLNYAKLLFTNEEKTYLAEWLQQTNALDQTISALEIAYGVMESRELRLADAYEVIETEPRYAEARPWIESLSQSPWSREVVAGEPLPKRPALPSDFGLDFKTDFIDENWKTFLSEQVNIANVYIFARGPAIAAALGNTKLGIGVAQALHLDKVIAAVKGLPAVVQKPALWMIYETADGCMIRYFYTAYLGLRQVGHDEVTRITGTEKSDP